MRDGFMVSPKHINFEAKKLFGEMGQIIDGAIAYINLKGGGPTEQHTHEHKLLHIYVLFTSLGNTNKIFKILDNRFQR